MPPDLQNIMCFLESPQHPAAGLTDDNLNISDVIEVIATDPDFEQSRSMFNGVPEVTRSPAMAQVRPRVRIIEQPASKALRFRYECEGRSAGSIPGVSSTPENKTFPSIQIVGYQGRAVVVVSCVTKDSPHRPHPHNLVGREGCKKGVCTLEVSPETMSVTFSNLGIQCVKKKDIESALRVREEIRVDPFRTGFSHRNQPTSIDLNSVRLCFQVFLEGDRGKFTVPLTPVVSDPIYDKKAMCDLVIVKLSDCTSSVAGGTKDVILLCEKVSKEDIEIRFYEERDGQVVWEGRGDFQPSQVHKQTAIWFKTPPYRRLDVTEPVKVFIQLRRPSDTATSEPLPFELLPLDAEPSRVGAKRPKFEADAKNEILLRLRDQERNRSHQPFNIMPNSIDVKTEPRDNTPSPYAGQGYGGVSPMYVTNHAVSPQPFLLPANTYVQAQAVDTITYNLPVSESYTPSSLPPVGSLLPPWNTITISASVSDAQNAFGASAMSVDPPTGLSSLLDLDSQQTELKQIDLNSGELATLNAFDTHNLSENLTNNLSLTDLNPPRQDHSMTDSFTQLANNVINSICQLNDMTKPN
ncbi:embryonic polarity protein dorsal-like isoform X2 [Photinus pyralis]|uniref:embryonic polarity protein dorsal-like isoform X2 n=1 Tax=Photinus pyralis TaxID=7054 RepID=UPI001266E5D8|nr:embryonic polarity protein dorsal-like isoform X2 [Photinus pyralis]